MTFFKRNLENKVRSLLTQFPAVALIGARQVGKTELAKRIGQRWRYFDLENPDDHEKISRDPLFFFKENPEKLILDEAQEYPEIFKVLRGVIDQDRSQKGRFLLTGSSSPELMTHLSDTLAGRIATIEVNPLKANEYFRVELSPLYGVLSGTDQLQSFKGLKSRLLSKKLQEFWLNGGYPEPTLSHDPRFVRQWMEEYRKTYVQRDIRKLFPKLNAPRYQRFLRLLSELSGTILNRSDLAALLDVSQPTVTEYLHIADGTFFWKILSSFEKSRSKSIVKMPKGYVRDSGLLHFLLKIQNLDALQNHPIYSRSFEGFVIDEVLRGMTASPSIGWEASYYRTRSRAEIDLILECEAGIVPIEIKSGIKTDLKSLITLKQFIQEHRCPFGLLINQSDQFEWLSDQIMQVPVGWI